MEIGIRLYELREAKGLTQDALGKRVGLAPTRISRVENGHVSPSLAVLERWAKALDVELSVALGKQLGLGRARSGLQQPLPLIEQNGRGRTCPPASLQLIIRPIPTSLRFEFNVDGRSVPIPRRVITTHLAEPPAGSSISLTASPKPITR